MGLKWEAAQNTCAKRVNGLDFQTARRFDRAGEQGARTCQLGVVDMFVDAKLLQFVAQFVIRHHRPSAKALKQAVLHLGRCCFGIGQAKDVLG